MDYERDGRTEVQTKELRKGIMEGQRDEGTERRMERGID